jgi:hypothetical protein
MKKATGPAKVEVSVTAQGSPVSGVVALLFNFDFDDAAVKPEHQNWLAENLVPPLRADPSSPRARWEKRMEGVARTGRANPHREKAAVSRPFHRRPEPERLSF